MKKILIINGHPNPDSFNFAIANEYQKGGLASGVAVEMITIASLNFNPNLAFGYQKRIELEPDLMESWDIWFGYILFGGADFLPLQKVLLIGYFYPEWLFNIVKIQFGGINF